MRTGFAVNRTFLLSNILGRSYVTYIQGQSPEPRVREYFYYIDHQGMVFFISSIEVSVCITGETFSQIFFI